MLAGRVMFGIPNHTDLVIEPKNRIFRHIFAGRTFPILPECDIVMYEVEDMKRKLFPEKFPMMVIPIFFDERGVVYEAF